MKKFLSLACALAALLALAAPARADLLWEPDNRFYRDHPCTYVDRSFYANGPDGFVTLWDEPEGSGVEAQYENGARLRVYWQYGDWGCVTVWEDTGHVDGWVPMAHLSLIYDYLSFEEEYGDRIQDYAGQFADYAGNADRVSFFAYPGAPQVQEVRELGTFPEVLANLTGTADSASYISRIFVDEAGRTWGFVSYMYGRLNAWFCLDDPEGEDFPVRDVAAPELIPASPPVLPAAAYTPYLLVAAVVIVTAGLLLWFYRRPQRRR